MKGHLGPAGKTKKSLSYNQKQQLLERFVFGQPYPDGRSVRAKPFLPNREPAISRATGPKKSRAKK